MKLTIAAGVLAAAALSFTAPASASLPPPLPRPNTSFQSGSLHVDVYGTAGKPALIFIPGLLCGPWEWAGEIAQFSRKYTIYALTLPGFDGRPAIPGPLFPRVTADFWSMLDAQRIERPTVIGHSLGGTLAIVLGEQHPQRLRAIVAVDGLPVFPGMENLSAEQRQAAAQRLSAALASARNPQAFEQTEKTYVLPALMSSPGDVAAVAPLMAKSDPQAAAQWAAEDLRMDARADLSKITVPLLEIAPEGALVPYYKTLVAGDPTATVEAVGNSRHFIMYDQPQALHALIARFLERPGP